MLYFYFFYFFLITIADVVFLKCSLCLLSYVIFFIFDKNCLKTKSGL